jgi:PAS domain S-box-containing protein
LALVLLGHWLLGATANMPLLAIPLGVGLALTAWLGYTFALALSLGLIALALVAPTGHATHGMALAEAVLTGINVAGAWWCYRRAGGARALNDPNSATLFLLLVPGLVSGLCALAIALGDGKGSDELPMRFFHIWIGRAVSILALAPALLVAVTPWLVCYGIVEAAPEDPRFHVHPRLTWKTGEILETIGLALGAAVLGLLLTELYARGEASTWHLWAVLLLVIVWASLRLGVRGGSIVSLAATVPALVVGGWGAPAELWVLALRGNLTAQCCTAILIGASADWIRASEARYRQIVGHIPVVLYSARFLRKPVPGAAPEVEILLVSSAALTVLGSDPKSLQGDYRAWMQRVHPGDRELIQAAVMQLLLQKQPVQCEFRLAGTTPAPEASGEVNRPGTANPLAQLASKLAANHRYVRDTLVPHYDSDGQLDGWDGVVEDVTEQRILAHDLRRTSNMLQALIAHLPTGIFFVHASRGQPLLVNARARQLLGQREDMAAGLSHLSSVYRLHKPDGTPYPWEELPVCKALKEGATSMRDDVVVHRPDGRRIPLVTWAAPVDLGGPGEADAAVWVLEDLSALRSAESARLESESKLREATEVLRLSEERYRGLMESLPIMVMQIGPDGAITYHNRATESIFGLSAQETQAPGFLQRQAHPDDAPRLAALLSEAASGKSGQGEFRFHTAKGAEILGYATAQPISGGGTALQVIDWTQRRRYEQELQKVQRLELVARIASGVVHDFNNLLTVILGYTDLARKACTDASVRADLDRVLQATDQAKILAQQLLAFSKQRKIETKPVDLGAAVKRAVDLLMPTMPHSIEWNVSTPAEPLRVKADDGPLQQVVINLCLNARDAMADGGRLMVETVSGVEPPDGASAGQTSTPLVNGHRWARLRVQDTGSGMDESVRAHLFEPLFTTKERGSGLGLAVVKQIVEGFGGCVTVESQPGHGSRFDVWLPAV